MKPVHDHGQIAYLLLKSTQRDFCKARIQMGVLLEHIKQNDHWKGRATSFAAFLEEEKINASAAYQYMRVARKFFYELRLSDAEFSQIATCNIGVLDMACSVITEDNKSEIISLLSALGERDARQTLAELAEDWSLDKPESERKSRPVSKLVGLYRSLPDEQRAEFLHFLSGAAKNGRTP